MSESQQIGWKKNIILFLTSQCITLFGSTLVQMAVVWYATMKTSSGVWVAAFTVCAYLPQFLISFLGGVWADRYNRKWLIISADALIAIVTLMMVFAIPYISSEPSLLGGLLLMSVIRSLGAGIQTPAVNAVIPQLVPEDQLMRYNGINATMQSVVQFAAPAAAGAIFAVSNLSTTLMVDIVTAMLGIGLLSGLLLPKQTIKMERHSVFADMKIGVRYAFSDKLIGNLLLTYGLFTFLCVPAGFLAGLFVRRVFGDTYWHLTAVELSGFAGMMVGGIVMSTWGGFRSRVKSLVVGLATFGVFAIGMGITRNFVLYLLDAVLWDCDDDGSNRHHDLITGKHRGLHAWARVWIAFHHVFGFSPGGNGAFRAFGRYHCIAMDYVRLWRGVAAACRCFFPHLTPLSQNYAWVKPNREYGVPETHFYHQRGTLGGRNAFFVGFAIMPH